MLIPVIIFFIVIRPYCEIVYNVHGGHSSPLGINFVQVLLEFHFVHSIEDFKAL